jgi:hypothetical protein
MKSSKPIKRKTPLKRSSKPLKRRHVKRKKKSALEKRKANPKSKYWRDRADTIWARLIRRPGKCAIDNEDCAGPLNAHHLISRRIGCLRHDMCNGIALCVSHHLFSSRLSPHKGSVGFAAWMANNRPEQWDWAMQNRWSDGPVNYKEAYEKLKEIEDAL